MFTCATHLSLHSMRTDGSFGESIAQAEWSCDVPTTSNNVTATNAENRSAMMVRLTMWCQRERSMYNRALATISKIRERKINIYYILWYNGRRVNEHSLTRYVRTVRRTRENWSPARTRGIELVAAGRSEHYSNFEAGASLSKRTIGRRRARTTV